MFALADKLGLQVFMSKFWDQISVCVIEANKIYVVKLKIITIEIK